MRLASILFIACVTLPLTACESWDFIVDSYRINSPTAYTARIDAAKALSNADRKDQLLARIVVDAATHSNELQDVKYGIHSISGDEIKEQAAIDAADALFKRGHYEWARHVAMMIQSSERRDKILEKLAEGGPPPT